LIQVGTSILCADPKCGKSTLARQLAVAVAEEKDFLGFPTVGGDVLYLFLEGPLGAVQMHLKKLGHTGQRGTIHVIDERMPDDNTFGLARLSETMKRLPNVRLVIVDPLSKLLRLQDSDKGDEVGPAMEQVEKFAKTHRLHAMALAHQKKKKDPNNLFSSMMNSTAFRGATDTNISLSKQGTQRIIETESRWGPEIRPTLLKFDEEREASSLDISVEKAEQEQHAVRDKKKIQRIEGEIIDALRRGKRLTTGKLLEEVTGKTTTVLTVLEQMKDSGKLQTEQDGPAILYSITPIPDESAREAA
jgi:hypothetical protein